MSCVSFFLYLSHIFFVFFFGFVHTSFPFLAKEREGRRAEDVRVSYAKARSHRQRRYTCSDGARFNGAHALSTFLDSRKNRVASFNFSQSYKSRVENDTISIS